LRDGLKTRERSLIKMPHLLGRSKSKDIFFTVILSICSVVVALVVCELFLRIFMPLHLSGYIGAYQYDDELAAVPKKSLYFVKTKDYQEEFRTNHFGTVNFQEDFSQYEHLIFAIGDSYTQGTGLPSDASYPAQLDFLMNMKEGNYKQIYGIVNLGLAAYGPEQEFIALKRYVAQLGKPKAVLLLGCSNDYSDDMRFRSGAIFMNPIDGSPHYGPFLHAVMWFLYDLEIGKRVRLAIRDVWTKRNIDNPSKTDGNSSLTIKNVLPVYDRIKEYLDQNEMQLIVSWSTDGADYEELQKWAATNHILFADWRPAVNSVLSKVPELPTENNHSGGHHRVWVNNLIAQAYLDKIKKALSR